MIWVFSEDMNGKYGCLGSYDSEVRAHQVADDYEGISYIKDYPTSDGAEARRSFRGEMARKKGPEEIHRNVRTMVLEGE